VRSVLTAAVASAMLGMTTVLAATPQQVPPSDDIRTPDLRRDAIVGATVTTRPGESIENATILLRDGLIEAIGETIEIPAGYRVHDASGLRIYPGFIDASVERSAGTELERARRGAGAHWNERIVPQVSMRQAPGLDAGGRTALREQGFGIAQVLPDTGILRGRAAIVLLGEADDDDRLLGDGMHVAAFETGGWSGGYPSSQMGAIALMRQTFEEAIWHAAAKAMHVTHPDAVEMPEQADALDALAPVVAGEVSIAFHTGDELEALRAASIAAEAKVPAVILGSGTEFRRISEIAATGLPVIAPVKYPETPSVKDPYAADRVSLRDLQTWKHAPSNARRLLDAGTSVALTTRGLERPSGFHAGVRKAIEAGLPADEALACITVRPAKLLGIDHLAGTIEPGRVANLVVIDGELFDEKAEIREVWVAGRRDEVKAPPAFPLDGAFTLLVAGETRDGVEVSIDRKKERLSISMPAPPDADETATDADGADVEVTEAAETTAEPADTEPEIEGDEEAESDESDESEDEDATADEPASKNVAVRNTKFGRRGLGFAADGAAFGVEGDVSATAVVMGDRVVGSLETRSGDLVSFEFIPVPPAEETEEEATDDDADEADDAPETDDAETADETEAAPVAEESVVIEQLTVPLGVYGRLEPPRSRTVVVRNATLWTVSDAGILEGTDMLVENGRIAAIGRELAAPADALEIDATGLHVSPGLIDCHSHTGISGGVNEGGQNNTAEVGIQDVINPDDIDWFRQLAGGLTAANQLHGSANPIGGRNSVVKLRWGGTVEDMRFAGAPAGIKFALGENVKRGGGYPDTRMGVAAFIEDAFQAARERDAAWGRWSALSDEERARTVPPRPDHELDAIAEILAGDRLIHCHSYRQDEILMLLRLCERYGVRIGTLQHILEGYKVADAIASHGAGASSFSDWWAYKMEVMDAIPYNGALMHDVGVVVSFNSDDDEVATRMNDEAAKAVRWGGLDPQTALAFVTLNPAKQLGVDDRVGSLEIGKDADFVIWTASPLSAYSRCEQTWIDGARYYDRAEAEAAHASAMLERGRLLADASGADTDAKNGDGSGDGPGRGARGRRGPRPTRLLARMLEDRDAVLLERVARGEDPASISAGDCGCGSGSMIELARSLARDRARLGVDATLDATDSENAE
jgi:imidazolonepropionase-like amidohydrolase